MPRQGIVVLKSEQRVRGLVRTGKKSELGRDQAAFNRW